MFLLVALLFGKYFIRPFLPPHTPISGLDLIIFNAVYDREVPFEVRTSMGDEEVRQGSLETIKVRLW